MAWPVARPAEEVGVLAMATSERAAPKDRPPLFLEGGHQSRWAGPGREDLIPSPLDDPTLDAGWP